MVTRLLESAGAFGVFLFLGVGLAAQQPATPQQPVASQGAPPPAAGAEKTPPAAPAASATSGTSANQDDQPLALVLAEKLPLRCFASESSPLFEDELTKGRAVVAGKSEGGFRAVLLPLGPVGYVNKKFATEPVDGKVKTKGRSVSFRYRPKSSELPVKQLDDGTEMLVLGEKDDWWRVRCAGVEAWTPEADVQVADKPDAALKAAHAELAQLQAKEGEAWLAALAAAKEKARVESENGKKLAALQQSFAKELTKPAAEQTLQPIADATVELAAAVGPESALAPSVAALHHRIEQQQWVREATAVRDAEPKPPADLLALPPGEVKDELERFQSVGWLRYRKALGRPGQFLVEKGGQQLFLVTCDSGRYDLSLFIDKEVGLIGPRRRPAAESLRVLDVEKIEVLGLPIR